MIEEQAIIIIETKNHFCSEIVRGTRTMAENKNSGLEPLNIH
jgi:hypothetical protein